MVFIALQYLNISLKVIRYSDVCNVNVVKKLCYKRFVRERWSIRTFLVRITINQSNPSNQTFKVKIESILSFLIRKPKESPRQRLSSICVKWRRRGYSPLYYRGIGCVECKLNGPCNGETSSITLKQNFKILLTTNAKLTTFNFLQCGNILPWIFERHVYQKASPSAPWSQETVCRQTNLEMLSKFSRMNSPVQILTKRGGGLDCCWSVTKTVTKK